MRQAELDAPHIADVEQSTARPARHGRRKSPEPARSGSGSVTSADPVTSLARTDSAGWRAPDARRAAKTVRNPTARSGPIHFGFGRIARTKSIQASAAKVVRSPQLGRAWERRMSRTRIRPRGTCSTRTRSCAAIERGKGCPIKFRLALCAVGRAHDRKASESCAGDPLSPGRPNPRTLGVELAANEQRAPRTESRSSLGAGEVHPPRSSKRNGAESNFAPSLRPPRLRSHRPHEIDPSERGAARELATARASVRTEGVTHAHPPARHLLDTDSLIRRDRPRERVRNQVSLADCSGPMPPAERAFDRLRNRRDGSAGRSRITQAGSVARALRIARSRRAIFLRGRAAPICR